jgi:hypothetical protein
MIVALRKDHPSFLYSTSGGGAQADTGRGLPSPALAEADDYVLIHGNGLRPAGVEAAIQAIRAMPAWQANPKPIVINEESPALPNLGGAAERLRVGLNRTGIVRSETALAHGSSRWTETKSLSLRQEFGRWHAQAASPSPYST